MPSVPSLRSLFPPDLQASIKGADSDDLESEDQMGMGWEAELPPGVVQVIKAHQARGGLFFKGEGSSRAVFDLGKGVVLKVAKNGGGLMQTQNEIQISKKFKNSRWLPRVWKFDPGGRWIIMEEAHPATQEAEDLLTVRHPGDGYGTSLVNCVWMTKEDPEEFAREIKPHLTPDQAEFLKFMIDSGLDTGDIYPEHMGKTASGRLVLMDFGV